MWCFIGSCIRQVKVNIRRVLMGSMLAALKGQQIFRLYAKYAPA